MWVMSSAGGLGILASGNRPHELLHLVYGGLAFAAIPVGDSLSTTMRPRRKALARVLAAAFAVAVIARLFATG